MATSSVELMKLRNQIYWTGIFSTLALFWQGSLIFAAPDNISVSKAKNASLKIVPKTEAWIEKSRATGDVSDNCVIHYNVPSIRSRNPNILWINDAIQQHYESSLPKDLKDKSQLTCDRLNRVYVLYETPLNTGRILSLFLSAKWSVGKLEFGKSPQVFFPLTLDLKDKKSLRLSDLFKKEIDYSKLLNDKVQKYLDKNAIPPVKFSGIKDNQPFYLGPNKLTLVFSSGELTQYGEKIQISKKELQGFMNAWVFGG